MDAHLAEDSIQSDNLQPLFQAALAGNDQFYLSTGIYTLNGEGGFNTVYEPGASPNYSISTSGSAVLINGDGSADMLYNIQGAYFTNGFADFLNGTFTPNGQPNGGFAAVDQTTGGHVAATPTMYSGPVAGLQNEFAEITPDNLNISVSSDNWFILTGGGNDAIAVKGGNNVLDGGGGSNFLVGGNGSDTFYVDDRGVASNVWSTVVNFHSGDYATVWGVTPQDFNIGWGDDQGAVGNTGLTLHATAPGHPNAYLTLAGYSTADLSNGRLSTAYGTDTSGNHYMLVHGN